MMHCRNLLFPPAAFLALCLGLTSFPAPLHAQEGSIPFTSEEWQILNGVVEDFEGRSTLAGSALLPATDFHNGVLEVDMYFTGDRCFAGFYFRVQSGTDFENLYLRPHKSGKYDAVQYQPVFGGQSGWQLYALDGYTAAVEIPHHEWVHVKMEVMGSRARIFINRAPEPVLVVTDLKHGDSHGPIGLQGAPGGLLRFADFSWRSDDTLVFDSPPPVETPPGTIMEWELSRALQISTLDRDHWPLADNLGDPQWRRVTAESSGLLNIARHVPRNGEQIDCVLARATLSSDRRQVKKLLFGYSDEVSVFFNGRILFRGNSAFRLRDPDFTGVMGLHDAVYLELEPGENELILAVSENFGGWGLIARLVDPGETLIDIHDGVEPVWTATGGLTVPESVLCDPDREVLYVSNYIAGAGYVSKVSLDGEVLEARWVEGIPNATGMGLRRDRLFVAGLTSVFEIDVETGEIAAEHPVEGAVFLNDIVIDSRGTLYITDGQARSIFSLRRGRSEVWLSDDRLATANGLCLDGDTFILGAGGGGVLYAIERGERELEEIVSFGQGPIIDGIAVYDDGRYLVSDWNGITRLITRDGTARPLLDTRRVNMKQADFCWLAEAGLLFIPTFGSNSVAAYSITIH